MNDDILLPLRIAALPRDALGRPIPWFVHLRGGKPDFTSVGPGRLERAIAGQRCWICGDRLGKNLAFVLGAACAINRLSAQPPSHRECAAYGVQAWHSPDVVALWVVRDFRLITGHPLGQTRTRFELDEPLDVVWFRDGRRATRREVNLALLDVLPALSPLAALQGAAAVEDFKCRVHRVFRWLPDEDDDAAGVGDPECPAQEAASPDAATVTTVTIQQRSA